MELTKSFMGARPSLRYRTIARLGDVRRLSGYRALSAASPFRSAVHQYYHHCWGGSVDLSLSLLCPLPSHSTDPHHRVDRSNTSFIFGSVHLYVGTHTMIRGSLSPPPQMGNGGSPPAHLPPSTALDSSYLSDPSQWLHIKWSQPPPHAPAWLFEYYDRGCTTFSRREKPITQPSQQYQQHRINLLISLPPPIHNNRRHPPLNRNIIADFLVFLRSRYHRRSPITPSSCSQYLLLYSPVVSGHVGTHSTYSNQPRQNNLNGPSTQQHSTRYPSGPSFLGRLHPPTNLLSVSSILSSHSA